jgi:tellurite resistance protein TerC
MAKTLKQLRRLIVAVVGFTVLAIGVAMMILPGPATLVIPAGIAILATEFVWARRLMNRFQEELKKQKERLAKRRNETPDVAEGR